MPSHWQFFPPLFLTSSPLLVWQMEALKNFAIIDKLAAPQVSNIFGTYNNQQQQLATHNSQL